MKKKLIKKGELIFGNEFYKHYLYDEIILHKTNLNSMLKNNFIRTFFTFAHSINEIEENVFGITYKRETTTFMNNLLKYICDGVNEDNFVEINGERKEFTLIPLNHKITYGNYNELFKIKYEESIVSHSQKTTLANKVIDKINRFLKNYLEFINAWINACLNGEIPMLKEKIEICNEEGFPYFSYELDLFFNSQSVLTLGSVFKTENPYNVEIFNKFIEDRESKINSINNILNGKMMASEFLKQRYFIKFDSFFKKMNISKSLCVPKEINSSKNFNDENAVFQIDPTYTEFSGKISVNRFFKIKNSLTEKELYNFVNSLKEI